MKQRDWESHGIVGFRAQGKSPLVRDLFKCYDLRSQKILVLTPSIPKAYEGFPVIKNIESLQRRWKGVFLYYNHQSAKQMLKDVHDLVTNGYLKNGLIVFEDCTNYIDPYPSESIKNFLVNNKNYDLDLIFTTHMLRLIPKFCRGMLNSITVFKTNEVFEKPQEMRALDYPNYTELYNAWKRVMAAPNDKKKFIQYHETILTGV